MIHKLSRTLGTLGRACSDFGSYFITFHRRCFKSGRREDCEGLPTFDEARKDYQDAVRSKL